MRGRASKRHANLSTIDERPVAPPRASCLYNRGYWLCKDFQPRLLDIIGRAGRKKSSAYASEPLANLEKTPRCLECAPEDLRPEQEALRTAPSSTGRRSLPGMTVGCGDDMIRGGKPLSFGA